jgi:hypothetical protein
MQTTITLTDITINKTRVDSIDLTIEWSYHWESEFSVHSYREIDDIELIDWNHFYDDLIDDDDVIDWFEFNTDIIEQKLLEK